MGRPLKEIDAEQVFKLAQLGCTQEEIGDFFGVSQQCISERFQVEYTRARSHWKQSLRRAQTRRAIRDGSDSMLIHLGKTYLGQTDRLDVTSNGTSVQPVFRRIDNARDEGVRPPASTNGVCGEHS